MVPTGRAFRFKSGKNNSMNCFLGVFTIIYFVIADSQVLPNGTDVAVPSAYQEVKNDSFRGNFLAVVGREDADKQLLSLMKKYYDNGKLLKVRDITCLWYHICDYKDQADISLLKINIPSYNTTVLS